jgi:23S rRNA (adenine-N6)-dimethyltransferase
VSGRHPTARDERRRSYGQNFLVDQPLIERVVAGLDLDADQLVVEIGVGNGVLTRRIIDAGARVWAVERDHVWADRLRSLVDDLAAGDRVRVIETDARRLRLPREPYHVAANPPFGLTTDLLAMLLDRPERGPIRADLVLQAEVARKHAATPPVALRTAGWAPWWQFELGESIGRGSFRPRPAVDAAVLTIRRRTPPILPERLAADFAGRLRRDWG